jgi:large subunit ribosomal protein L9
MREEDVALKVILTEDISALGSMGAIVDVAKGYARNYLIPQGKAMEATPGNLARVEQSKSKYVQTQAQARETILAQADRLQGVSLTIAQRVGEEERLYGSVTAAMIAEGLEAKGFAIEKKQVELEEPIKKLGSYDVAIRLGPEAKATITVDVVPETA